MHRLNKLSEQWGSDLWIKRDDLTESGLSGNKVRKLEYLISDAQNANADTLISCGGIQSNHCRATALVAARFGMRCRLLLRGDKPSELDGNLLFNHLAGAQIEFIDPDSYLNNLQIHLDRMAENAVKDGLKPYIISEGGSNSIGAWGYRDAISEVKFQCDNLNIEPNRIVCATGSGGTHAGMWLGACLDNWSVDIVSIAVCYSAEETVLRIKSIIDEAIDRFNLNIECNLEDINVLDGYIGDGYAIADNEVYGIMNEVARSEGLLVDPVYTGKAIRAVKHEAISGRIPGVSLFWHTGGVYGIFPFRQELGKFLADKG